MNNEHARAKDAYDNIEKAVQVEVDASGLESVPEDASSLIWLDNGKLVCSRSFSKEEMKRLRTLDGEPWKRALENIQEKYSKSKELATLNTWALKVPSMLQSQGLLQTAAVLQDKFNGKPGNGKNVYWLLSQWLLSHVPWLPEKKKSDLMATLNKLEDQNDQEAYRFAHREAIAYMIWVKRAASVNLAGVGPGD